MDLVVIHTLTANRVRELMTPTPRRSMRYLMTPDTMPSAWFNVIPHLPQPLAAPSAPRYR